MSDNPLLFVDPRVQDKWENYWQTRAISLQPKPLFTKEDRIFTVGSCFASEIKRTLMGLGVNCLPDYSDILVDKDKARYENDDDRFIHLQHYNSYTILYEFMRIVGEWTQNPDDYWTVKRYGPWKGEVAYQDPYRRRIYGRSVEALHEVNETLNRKYKEGFEQATAFFFTFGMAEVFRQKSNGMVACQRPFYAGGGGTDETELYLSSFGDNFANMDKLVGIIRKHKPDAKIVMTVSPVPLTRCFSNRDVVIANNESKSILRAAVGEIARKHGDVVTYFPSYEAVVTQNPDDVFTSDGYDNRHIKDEIVRKIMRAFVANHFTLPEPPKLDMRSIMGMS